MALNSDRIPLSLARKWADRVAEVLSPHCERVEIAGSVRRGKEEVGDIEIVCMPKRPFDLLGMPAGASEGFIDAVDKWESVKGTANGRYTKRVLPNTNGFTLDIFMADAQNWGWIFALRTGSAIFAQKIYLRGLREADCFACDGYVYDYSDALRPKLVPLPEEDDLFKLLRRDFVPPTERNLNEW